MPKRANYLQEITYPPEAITQLTRRLDDMMVAAEAFRDDNWSQDHRLYWDMYYAQPRTTRPIWPWRGASAFFMPLGRSVTDGIVAQEHDAALTNDPLVKVTEVQSGDQFEAEQLSIYYAWLYERVIKLQMIGGDFFLNNCVDGSVLLSYYWDKTPEVSINTRTEQLPIYQTETIDFLGTRSESRTVTGFRSKTVEEFEVVPADRPVMVVDDLDSLIMSPDTGASLDASECPWYGIEAQWSLADLIDRKRRGYEFGTDARFEQLRAMLAPADLSNSEQAKRKGQSVSQTEVGKSLRVIEWYMPLVLPGAYKVSGKIVNQEADDEDGYAIECIVTYIPSIRQVCRIVPLQRIYPDGKRPHLLNQYCRVPGHPYGLGVMQRARQLNKLINSSVNQMMDYGTLLNLPFFFYNPTATGGALPDMTSIAPGQGVPVGGDPRSIYSPRLNGDPGFFQLPQNVAQAWAERDLSINDFNLNKGQGAGAPKTARMGLAMLNQGQIMFGRLVAQHTQTLKDAFYRVHELHRRYSKDQIFTVTGMKGNQFGRFKVPQYVFQQDANFDFVLNPNRAFEQQMNERILLLSSKIPQIANNPEGMRELWREYYQSFGKKNADGIWPAITVQSQQAQQNAVEQAGGLPPTQAVGAGAPGGQGMAQTQMPSPPPQLPGGQPARLGQGAGNVVPFSAGVTPASEGELGIKFAVNA